MIDYQIVSKILLAIESEDIETLDEIISGGFDINREFLIKYSRINILTYASIKNKIESVKWALSKGANVNFKDECRYTALIFASSYGHTEIVKLLLTKCNSETIKIKDVYGYTALTWACRELNTETVKALLPSCDLSMIIIQNEDGENALMLASFYGGDEIVKEILTKCNNASMNIKTLDGDTVLMIAARRGYIEIVKSLLTKCDSKTINIKNEYGHSAIDVAKNSEIKKIITDKLESLKPVQRDYNFLSDDVEQEFIKNDYRIDTNIHPEALAYVCYKGLWDLVSKIIEKKQIKTSFFLGFSAQEWCFLRGEFELGNRFIAQTENSQYVINLVRASCKKYLGDDSMVNECKSKITKVNSIESEQKSCVERCSLPVFNEQIRLKEIEQQIEQLKREKKKLTEK